MVEKIIVIGREGMVGAIESALLSTSPVKIGLKGTQFELHLSGAECNKALMARKKRVNRSAMKLWR